MKNQNKSLEESFVKETPLKGNSILDTLYKQNDNRDKQYKNIAKKLSQSYQEEDNVII